MKTENIAQASGNPNQNERKVAIQFLLYLYCDRSIHGSFLFSSSCSSWEQITFSSAISMHNFIKAQQHMHIHIPIYSVLLKFEPEKQQHQPQNLQELQNPIRPCTQSPSCLSISHCPFWSYPHFVSQFILILPLHFVVV